MLTRVCATIAKIALMVAVSGLCLIVAAVALAVLDASLAKLRILQLPSLLGVATIRRIAVECVNVGVLAGQVGIVLIARGGTVY